jgi:hypothetical protein
MIYFIQDQSTFLIKIGYTGADDAAARLKQLQTGCPSGLVLLATTDGDQLTERQLHDQFAAHRERGEWFRPHPSVLRWILHDRPHAPVAASPVTIHPTPAARPWPLKIYLAGKIRQNCWRQSIVAGLREALSDDCPSLCVNDDPAWPLLERSVFGVHSYTGPYFVSCDHGCYHGDDEHGQGTQTKMRLDHNSTANENVVLRCLDAIKRSDLIFAWVDEPDCYGTVVEVGYAAALGKTVAVSGPKRYRDMWFLYLLANGHDYGGLDYPDAESALKAHLSSYRSSQVSR